jgi:hypothetical protein
MKKKLLLSSLLLIIISTNFLSAQGISNVSGYGGTKSDYPYRLIKDNLGNHYVIGFFASPTMQIGTTTLVNGGDTNAFIAKFDNNWNALWAKSGSGTGVNYGLSCVADNLGNCYMVGCFYGNSITFGSNTLLNTNPTVSSDIFIVKYSSTGTVLWAKKAGGTGTDKAIDIDVDNNNEVVMTGWFYSPSIMFGTTNLINSSSGTADIFVAKYNISGTVVWAKKATGTENDEPTSISIDGTGNIYLTGWFSSDNLQFGTINLVNKLGYFPRRDMFIIKYNSAGSEQWAKDAGGTGQDGGSNIAVDDGGNYIYVTGSFNSDTLKIGSQYIKNSLGYDFFLSRFDKTGQLLWVKGSTGMGDETGSGMAVDNRGYVYVIGGFTSVQMFIGFDTLFNKSITDPFGKLYPDVFYARYNPDGTEEWAASLGGRKNDVGTSVTIEDYYKISMTGVFTDTIQMGSGGPKLYGKGGTDIFLAEYRFINIGGTATYTTSPITKGYAELMRINPGKRAPIADRVSINASGKYRFTDVKPGSYYIYAVADPATYPTLVKTYYANSPYWTGARIAKVLATDTLIDTLNISMVDILSVPTGTGKIGGRIISTDGTRAAGSPIKDVEITLMKIPPSKIAKKAYTNSDGEYNVSDLDIGNYQVMMDIPGLKIDTAFFLNIASGTTVFKNRNYAVDAKGIHRDTSEVGIFTDERIANELYLYPNPTQGKVFLQLNSIEPGLFNADIYDLSGKQFLHQLYQTTTKNENISLDLISLPKGIYLLRLTSSENVYYARIILSK